MDELKEAAAALNSDEYSGFTFEVDKATGSVYLLSFVWMQGAIIYGRWNGKLKF